ncbi:MAG: hypothetical protein EAZ43_07150 [Betaproteobacteria bacterium]|nr:MAG: hypothetical protein EAZ43_07150 [Betaproteobacteria bacterium]
MRVGSIRRAAPCSLHPFAELAKSVQSSGEHMKYFRVSKLTIATAIAFGAGSNASMASDIVAAPGRTLQPAPAASWPHLNRPDLVADSTGAQFGFSIRNIGTGNSPSSITLITCTAWSTATPTKGGGGYVPCVEGTHYVTLGGPLPPAGTSKSGNVWKVPTGALAATTGQTTFTLNIKTTPAQRTRGLNFEVCADANNAIAELSESNNCKGFNYTWPN